MIKEQKSIRKEGVCLKQSDLTRTILSATVDKAIDDIRKDPDRTARNLIDLGLHFSNGAFQKRLFATAQNMLKNEESTYYTLIKDIVYHVEQETLKTFGMNLGYNGCTNGACLIRENEEKYGYNIPWAIAFTLAPGCALLQDGGIEGAITQARALGVYTYLLFCTDDCIEQVSRLITQYGDCAFLLFTTPEVLTSENAARLCGKHNLMVSILADSPAFLECAAQLRDRKFLFAAHCYYTDSCDALEAMLEKVIVPSHSVFAFFIAEDGSGTPTRERTASQVRAMREAQRYPAILIDLYSDLLYIDQIVSDEACSVGFCADGSAYLLGQSGSYQEYNVCNRKIADILKEIVPRKKQKTEK